MIRSFVGIPLPDAAVAAVERLQGDLTAARPVPAENLHVTLAFLDAQPEHVLRDLADALDPLDMAPFPVTLSGVALMGGGELGAIGLEADGGPALPRLHARVVAAARSVGIEIKRRRFQPHVTIFRRPKRTDPVEHAKIQRWLDHVAPYAPITFSADRAVLYQSTLSKHGARYDPLTDFPFGLG